MLDRVGAADDPAIRLACQLRPTSDISFVRMFVDMRGSTRLAEKLRAAARLTADVDDLNQVLAHDGREPIRFGGGIHGGVVIVGDIGNSDHMVFIVLGDAVNVAARLQDMTKVLGCETILSEKAHQRAGLPPDALPAQDAVIRGRAGTMRIHAVTKSSMLARLLDNKSASPAPVIGA